jgi:hypothetical protein
MFLVPNIDQMYKEMKKIVEVGNEDEFPDFADLFFFGIHRPSIDASYQISVHLAQGFQRRRILKISQSETRIACGGHVC